jgi:hypothetical protein
MLGAWLRQLLLTPPAALRRLGRQLHDSTVTTAPHVQGIKQGVADVLSLLLAYLDRDDGPVQVVALVLDVASDSSTPRENICELFYLLVCSEKACFRVLDELFRVSSCCSRAHRLSIVRFLRFLVEKALIEHHSLTRIMPSKHVFNDIIMACQAMLPCHTACEHPPPARLEAEACDCLCACISASIEICEPQLMVRDHPALLAAAVAHLTLLRNWFLNRTPLFSGAIASLLSIANVTGSEESFLQFLFIYKCVSSELCTTFVADTSSDQEISGNSRALNAMKRLAKETALSQVNEKRAEFIHACVVISRSPPHQIGACFGALTPKQVVEMICQVTFCLEQFSPLLIDLAIMSQGPSACDAILAALANCHSTPLSELVIVNFLRAFAIKAPHALRSLAGTHNNIILLKKLSSIDLSPLPQHIAVLVAEIVSEWVSVDIEHATMALPSWVRNTPPTISVPPLFSLLLRSKFEVREATMQILFQILEHHGAAALEVAVGFTPFCGSFAPPATPSDIYKIIDSNSIEEGGVKLNAVELLLSKWVSQSDACFWPSIAEWALASVFARPEHSPTIRAVACLSARFADPRCASIILEGAAVAMKIQDDSVPASVGAQISRLVLVQRLAPMLLLRSLPQQAFAESITAQYPTLRLNLRFRAACAGEVMAVRRLAAELLARLPVTSVLKQAVIDLKENAQDPGFEDKANIIYLKLIVFTCCTALALHPRDCSGSDLLSLAAVSLDVLSHSRSLMGSDDSVVEVQKLQRGLFDVLGLVLLLDEDGDATAAGTAAADCAAAVAHSATAAVQQCPALFSGDDDSRLSRLFHRLGAFLMDGAACDDVLVQGACLHALFSLCHRLRAWSGLSPHMASLASLSVNALGSPDDGVQRCGMQLMATIVAGDGAPWFAPFTAQLGPLLGSMMASYVSEDMRGLAGKVAQALVFNLIS